MSTFAVVAVVAFLGRTTVFDPVQKSENPQKIYGHATTRSNVSLGNTSNMYVPIMYRRRRNRTRTTSMTIPTPSPEFLPRVGNQFIFQRTIIDHYLNKIADCGSVAEILDIDDLRHNVDVLLNKTMRFTVSTQARIPSPYERRIKVQLDGHFAVPGSAFLLTRNISKTNVAGTVCQVLLVDEKNLSGRVLCDDTNLVYNVTRRDGIYSPLSRVNVNRLHPDRTVRKIEFRPDLHLVKINSQFRFTHKILSPTGKIMAQLNDVAIVTNIPGKNGMLATVRTERNGVFGIDHTMGVFLFPKTNATKYDTERVVHAEQEGDDDTFYQGSDFVYKTHVLMFLCLLYAVGKLGAYFSIGFDTIAGCGMNVTQLSPPLMVWYYLCLLLSKVWAILELGAVVTVRALVVLKNYVEEKLSRDPSIEMSAVKIQAS
eukprot:TRINITY_DN344_c0_g2_i1.p1 TRINITY_DN344_c0_g2~~TRINITY_DN344_c0_g2_i1.p1  ORF type:complete len:444 (+),score=42.38 TRINITY_DN344_c0_g2_i1:53-1333(+)